MVVRVGVDLTPLKAPLTGVGNYTFHLLEALLREPGAPAFEGFRGLSWRSMQPDYFERNRSDLGVRSRLQQAHGFRWLRQNEALRQIYNVVRRQAFATRAGQKSISLFHAFAYLPPANLTVPIIPVIYDLSFVRFPEMHPPARVRALHTLGRHIQLAPAIHTISRFSAREIEEVYGIERSRITVIYPGVKPIFATTASNSADILASYELSARHYFLVVSTLEPRKNLRTLVSAYLQIPQSMRAHFPLCVVGAEGWHKLDLPKGYNKLKAEGSLRFLGFVPDIHLRSLYDHARAMMYPSTYEGFGMPIIEALASGTPVVCSNTTSMPEAAGAVSRTVSPLDVEAWTEEFRRAADDPSTEQTKMRQAHASQFTWELAARQTIELYAKVQPR
jgi:glycosyltransferase involved in cell wall biosynthesis